MSLPPDITSSMAISSAMRVGGLYSGTALPSTQILTRSVRWMSAAAIKLGDGMRP